MIKLARVRNPEYLEEKDLFSKDLLGVDQIINPQSAMVETIISLMEIAGASDVVQFEQGRIKLVGFTVTRDSPINGRQLASFKEKEKNLLIGAIVREGQVFIPQGKDILQEDDLVYAVAKKDELTHILRILNIKDEALHRIIIVGGGQTGEALAAALDHSRVNVKLVERDAKRCTEISKKLDRVIVIKGDGTDRALLEEENIRNTDLLVAITGDEESNVLMSLLAKALGASKTIARVSKLSYIPLISEIGIDTVVSPRLSAARAILQHIRRGKIISVVPLKGENAEAIEVEALETSDIVNVPLSEVDFPEGAILGAAMRGHDAIIPGGDTVILPGDRLIIFSLKKAIPKIEKLLTVKLEYF
jgi:trk system potassium uptake protein TrkA